MAGMATRQSVFIDGRDKPGHDVLCFDGRGLWKAAEAPAGREERPP
jgi:hypothetical protein